MSDNKYEMPEVESEAMPFDNITKRDGTLAPFDSHRIFNAINKAGTTTGEFGSQESWLLTAQVLKA